MMHSYTSRRLLRSAMLCLGMATLLLACRLPQPPLDSSEAPLVSPLAGKSPLATTSPLATPDGEGGQVTWIPFVGGPGTGTQRTRSTWTLVGLAAVAGLLFVATAAVVFLLIRGWPKRRRLRRSAEGTSAAAKPGGTPDGAPEAGTDAAAFSEGTMLNEGRYLVLSAQAQPAGDVAYEVKPTIPVDLCPYCHQTVAADAGDTCAGCGRPLPEPRPEHPVLLAREVHDGPTFAVLTDLTKHRLLHPYVVVPVATFTETSFGPDKAFVVVPDVRRRLTDQRVGHVSVEQVLGWGVALAKGLEALHERAIALMGLDPAQVQVDGRDARWLCFDGVASLAELDADQVRARKSANVRDLAALLVAVLAQNEGPGGTAAAPDRQDLLKIAAGIAPPAGRVFVQVLKSTGRLHAADLAVALARAREELLQARGVRFEIGSHSDVGRIRKLNEDSHFTLDLSADLGDRAPALSIVAVADGVGGHDAGDVASRITVTTLKREVEALKSDLLAGGSLDAKDWIARAAVAANADVLSERQAMSSDMGSTLVMALVAGTRATVLNVGDSRAYRLGPSGIKQVSKDHSLVQRLVDIGQLTPEEARHHPQKSVIYRVMGDTPQLGYDLYELDLEPGEALLLCSDGLSDLVEDRMLWQVWRDVPELQDVCAHLVDLANEAGGYDNITVAIVQIQA